MRNPSSTPIRSVGIIRGKVRAISTTVLKGARTIDAKGLVVAPGFVDLHWHGVDAADGGEVGELLHGARHDLDGPLAMTALHELVNFGSGPLSVLSQITILYWPRRRSFSALSQRAGSAFNSWPSCGAFAGRPRESGQDLRKTQIA